MAGETIITIIGNLTKDPELKTIGNGNTVANFVIASNTRQFNRNTNQWENGDTLFLNCSAWDSQATTLASNIAASLHKGMTVIAQGRLMQRSYQAQDGSQRTVMELRVDDIGPSLRRATAQVSRQSNQQQGGFQSNGFAPQGGFQQAPQQKPAAQATPAAANTDPWANQSNTSFDSFGGSGFGYTEVTDTGEPDF